MSDKQESTPCEASLECKATASLQEEVKEELTAEDKPIQEILDEQNDE